MIVAAVCAVAIVFWFVSTGRLCVLHGDAMNPNLKNGDIIFAFGNKISRNAIVVFDNPLKTKNKKVLTVKRCVAMPNDTVLIDSNRLFINRKIQNDNFCISDFKLRFFSEKDIDKALKHSNLPLNREKLTPYVFSLRNSLADSLKKHGIVKNISHNVVEKGLREKNVFPYSKKISWNRDFFGPLVVPSCGYKIEITLENILIYKTILERFEGCKVEQKGNNLTLNGQISGFYQFKNNYYFLLNDNRSDVSDSRYFGLVPQNYVVAPVKFVLPNFYRKFNISN